LAYIFRFADDYQVLASGAGGEGVRMPLLRWILLAGVLGIPLKWSKLRGGVTSDFIGNQYDWRRLTGGLSTSRATWLINWSERVLRDKLIAVRELRSVIGRLSFSATLLRFLLPYLGPFYSWVAVIPDGAVRALPVCLLVILSWIRDRLAEQRLVELRPNLQRLERIFMADAKAEGDLVVVGGFEMLPGRGTENSRWFSYRLTPDTAPWAFARKGQAFRVISSLELFASLLCVMIFGFEDEGTTVHTAAKITMKGVTDNKSNEALVVKGMTTKFPSYLVLLEYTEQLRRRGWSMDLEWVPRDLNELADSLTNEDWSRFDIEKRVDRPLEDFTWYVLPKLYPHALELYKEMDVLRSSNKSKRERPEVTHSSSQKKKKKAARLDMPWDD
jgi:hypothetical protein